ncbi:MAG: type II secretion system F family protein [Candidatus Taylorbacteria bacterium]|nr:type II secretion system F family protein [Candidatus Taylorbacteria bacterium]
MNKKINQIFFAQRLSLLLNSGISIVEALSMMKNMERGDHVKKLYEVLVKDIEAGVSLSKSIKNAGIKWNNLLITLIQNGEEGGHLAVALQEAHAHLEKKNEMKKKIVSALVYPSFIVLATICMTLFLILYIFPKIIPLLSSLDISLPLITRIVQGLHYFLVSYGIWFGSCIVVICVGINLLLKKNINIRHYYHSLLLSIPIIRTSIKIHNMSSVCSMGEMLLSSGKGLPDMIIFSRESQKNLVFKEAFALIYIESMQGVSFSTSLRRYGNLFPPLLIDMCALGERTGNLGLMLGHCSRIFEQDMDNALKRFSSLIEPVLMVFMGLIVGSIALSIILPVYEITNHLSK